MRHPFSPSPPPTTTLPVRRLRNGIHVVWFHGEEPCLGEGVGCTVDGEDWVAHLLGPRVHHFRHRHTAGGSLLTERERERERERKEALEGGKEGEKERGLPVFAVPPRVHGFLNCCIGAV